MDKGLVGNIENGPITPHDGLALAYLAKSWAISLIGLLAWRLQNLNSIKIKWTKYCIES